jgi:hypothetical protein
MDTVLGLIAACAIIAYCSWGIYRRDLRLGHYGTFHFTGRAAVIAGGAFIALAVGMLLGMAGVYD